MTTSAPSSHTCGARPSPGPWSTARWSAPACGRRRGRTGRPEEFTVVTYHLVFRVSGLPAATPLAVALPLRLVADLDDWHQLDHYTAALVVLAADGRPVALTLQQHNYLRTYLVGESVELAPDGRFDIDVAIRSNELYPHVPGRTVRRAVRFLDHDARAFMMGFGKRPVMSADDITDPDRTVVYELAFLPGFDAFYAFHGFLGERRRLPAATARPGRATTPGPGSNLCPRRSSTVTGGRGTKATGRGINKSGERLGPAGFARAQAEVFHQPRLPAP